MEYRIETIDPKKLVGKSLRMSFAENRTPELWKSFMPRRREISNAVSTDLISMQIFGPSYDFNDPAAEFTKWAAVEVGDFDVFPADFGTFLFPGGLYTVFPHKGGPATAPKAFGYIFGVWLPASGYQIDDRPHFELLGEKYKNNDPDSEEEIWIPIKHLSEKGIK